MDFKITDQYGGENVKTAQCSGWDVDTFRWIYNENWKQNVEEKDFFKKSLKI